jgi:DNA-binding transcriptional LysR family regulator
MGKINFHFDELEGFIAVADKLSFRAAAEVLFISQPALSRRIERLEAGLGSRLLERTTRRVSLTAAGVQFLPHAKTVMEELARAADGIAGTAVQRNSWVTVASIPSVAHHWLPAVLQAFSVLLPLVRVRIIDESARSALESVVSGTADFGLNFMGPQETAIDFRAIRKEHYVLAVKRGHRYAGQALLNWSDLAGEHLISLSERSGNRALIDNALAGVPERPAVFYEAKHVAGALALVSAGLGVSVVPELSLSRESYPGLVGIALAGPNISRTIGLISRKGDALFPAAQALYDMIVKSAEA